MTNRVRFYKIIIAMIALGIIIVSTLFVHYNRDQSEFHYGEALRTSVEVNAKSIKNTIDIYISNTTFYSKAPQIIKILKDFNENKNDLSIEIKKANKKAHELLKDSKKLLNIEGYFLLSKDGKTLATTRAKNLFTENIILKDKVAWEKVKKGQSTVTKVLKSDVPLTGRDGKLVNERATLFVVSPVMDENDFVIGALAFRISPQRVYEDILFESRIGKSGESYAVTKEGFLASPSRFLNDFKGSYNDSLVSDTNRGALLFKVHDLQDNPTLMLSSVSRGERSQNLNGYDDYRGIKVIGAWKWIDELGIGITSEIDYSEAYASTSLLNTFIFLFATIFILTILYLMKLLEQRFSFLESSSKQAKMDLKTQAAFLDKTINAIPAVYFSTNLKGELLLINKEYERVFKVNKEDVIGSDLKSQKYFKENFNEVIDNKKLYISEVETFYSDQTRHFYRSYQFPYFDDEKNVMAFGSISVDITEIINKQEELMKAKEMALLAQEAKSFFLANMSHEIRTPLNGVLGCANLLSNHIVSDEGKKLLNLIIESGDALLFIVNDILDFTKLELNKLELNEFDFNLIKLMEAVCELFSPSADENGCELELRVDSNFKYNFHSDGNRIRQVVSNLISNAIKFSSKGKIIVDIKKRDDSQVSISIIDNGAGISSEDQEKLFLKFSQVGEGKKTVGGTGLGLAVSKKIVDLLGGNITVESELGVGTTFEVLLPLKAVDSYEETMILEKELGEEFSKNYPLNILVAEDNNINQLVVKKLLTKLGYNPTIVENGKLALEKTQTGEFDLVLMDCHMPIMDGYEASSAIKKLTGVKLPKIIALTAGVLEDNKVKCIEAGMDYFLMKPFKVNDFCSIIQEMTNKTKKSA